jgi:hypothetical protein
MTTQEDADELRRQARALRERALWATPAQAQWMERMAEGLIRKAWEIEKRLPNVSSEN